MPPITALLPLASLLLAILLAAGLPARADDGTVGTGSPASCTEAAFDAVFFAVQGSGGGTITFDCGPAQAAILFTAAKEISADTEIDGDDLVTLSGANATSLFQVYANRTLILRDVTLTRGYGAYGAVQNLGTLFVESSRLVENIAMSAGGAIESYGNVTITSSVIEGNSAAERGGGVLIDAATLTITNSRVDGNVAAEGGGIAATAAATVEIEGTGFDANRNTAVFGQGGAIRSEGALVVDQSEFTGNSGSRGGGLSVLSGVATVTQSLFSGNWSAYGGGIRQEGGDLVLTDVQFTHNGYASNGTKVNTGGGALSKSAGTATLTNVGMADNWASYGGAMDQSDGATTLTNATLSGNAAVGSGAIDVGAGSLTLVNVTIADNGAPFFAGGLGNRGGTLLVRNSLFSGNTNPDTDASWNCHQQLGPGNFNLSSDFTCGFGLGHDSVALPLAPLADNGGWSLTHLLPGGSPAIDSAGGIGCPATDQRGVPRPQGLACDVGAVEVPEPVANLLQAASLLALALARRRQRAQERRRAAGASIPSPEDACDCGRRLR